MNLRMMNDRIAVREITPPTVSSGGIFLGDAPADDGFVKEGVVGEVLAVGPGARLPNGERDSMWGIVAGQTIRYSPVLGHKETIDGEEVTFIRRDSVFGVQE
jgi:co-chaperonin GroES (HSP10)